MNGIGRERRPTRESETDAHFRVKVRNGAKQEACTRSLRDHTTSMQSEESRQATDNGGRVEPTKRQARTEGEVVPEVDGSEPKSTNGTEIRR